MKYLSQLRPNQLRNKICLLRVDLNIESPEKDAFRVQAILPTIKFLTKKGARVAILSHRGRPAPLKRGKQFSLKPFARILSRLLKEPVHFINNFDFDDIKNKIKNSQPSAIFLLENLRFFPEEERNDKQFAKKLASLGDIYINDAFAVSHRRNASIAVITQFLPSYAGLILEKEIKNLDSVMKEFKKPLIIILGGAKVSGKIGLINNFAEKADYFLIGGAMANTFFAGQGLPVGDSLYDRKTDLSGLVCRLGRKIILPRDLALYQRQILDIGPETIREYGEFVKKAKTIIWNGPMGFFENERFARGTKEVGKAICQLADKNKKARIVIGGGETVASLKLKTKNLKLKTNIFISTGGGAMLEYLAGKKLPGIEALK